MAAEQEYVCPDKTKMDTALRCAMTAMVTGQAIKPPPGTDAGLRWIASRTCAPRDMSGWAARRYRSALESTAALAGNNRPRPIPTEDRYDQDPKYFSVESWDLSDAFRGAQDFQGTKDEVKRANSDASTGSGSEKSKGSGSQFSSESGWDEEVLKKKGMAMTINEAAARRPSKQKKSFFGLFTPPWRSCACD
jgi:hypothetical protein